MSTAWDAKGLTVGELRKLLEEYPDSMPIAYSCCSEYVVLEEDDISAHEMYNNRGYISHVYRAQDKPLARTYLLLPGN